jgi:hypothetical protein
MEAADSLLGSVVVVDTGGGRWWTPVGSVEARRRWIGAAEG